MRSLILLLILGLAQAADNNEASELVARVQELDALSRIIQREYAKPIAREELWSGALAGMVTGLDGASRYLDREEVALYGSMQAGRGFGYGFDWQEDATDHGNALVMRVIPDSPAAKAGLIPGDRIVALNDERIAQIGMVAARRLLQRSENITLSLLHPDGRTSSLALERGDFNDSGVLPGRMIAQGIGLIRLARFRDGRDAESSPTVIAFRKEIELLRADGLQGLILDLRGNGGGSVIAAVAIADAFLNAGHDEPRVITTQISRNPARNHVYVARSNTTLPDWPLVVLIDRYTASSAEIVAAALKDHRRAALVGERSFGKNSIQELFVLDNGAALLLTVAHFRSPDELTFSGHGILPQVQLECDPVLRWRLDRRQFLLDQGLEVPAELQPLRDPIIEMATNMLTAAIIQVSH